MPSSTFSRATQEQETSRSTCLRAIKHVRCSSATGKPFHLFDDACHTVVLGRSSRRHVLSIKWLCVTDCHARTCSLQFACTPLSTRNALTMTFTYSRDLPGTSVTLAPCVGGGRPYLRSASVCPSASTKSSRFSGDTMFSV